MGTRLSYGYTPDSGSNARKAALTDNSLMPYGQHQGSKMIDVPASYLIWLYDNKKCSGSVWDYIANRLADLREEAKKEGKR